MSRDILPAQLEVERDEHDVVKRAVLRIGGNFAYPYKWVQWDVELDNVAHLISNVEALEQMKQDEPNSMSPRYEYIKGWNDAIDAVTEKAGDSHDGA